jgi:hypothetical protein
MTEGAVEPIPIYVPIHKLLMMLYKTMEMQYTERRHHAQFTLIVPIVASFSQLSLLFCCYFHEMKAYLEVLFETYISCSFSVSDVVMKLRKLATETLVIHKIDRNL